MVRVIFGEEGGKGRLIGCLCNRQLAHCRDTRYNRNTDQHEVWRASNNTLQVSLCSSVVVVSWVQQLPVTRNSGISFVGTLNQATFLFLLSSHLQPPPLLGTSQVFQEINRSFPPVHAVNLFITDEVSTPLPRRLSSNKLLLLLTSPHPRRLESDTPQRERRTIVPGF